MIVRLMHWICGCVSFSLAGADCGGVLTEIKRFVFSVKQKDGETLLYCSAKNYRYIARVAKKHRCKTRVKRRRGLPFLVKKYRFRIGLLIGLTAMILVLSFSILFVWQVDVKGNITTSSDEILAAAAEEGLRPGALISSIDVSEIEFNLKQRFEEIGWIAINRNATHYTIEISELTPKPEEVDKSAPCNIAAAYDGIILSIEPYSGFPLVKAGDVVKKDQLLVSGIKEEETGQVVYAHSSAKVIAQVERNFDYVRPLYTTRASKTGEMVQTKKFSVFGFKISLGFQKPPEEKYVETTSIEQLEAFGKKLPFYIETTTYEIVEETKIENDAEQLRRLLMDDAKEGEKELAGNKILLRKYVYETTEDSMILHYSLVVEQEIGEQRPIMITEDS